MKTVRQRKELVDKTDKGLSIKKQCELLSLNRSSLYYRPVEENELNLKLMRMMDEHYLEHPYFGAVRMYKWLTLDMDINVSLNRIERLYYKVMGLRSVLPGPHTSTPRKNHTVFPYLLRDLKIGRPDQVWATDITYIPMKKGFMYLMAVIDLHSRYVICWSLSNSMEAQWCAEVLEQAVQMHGVPEILNTDQGSQFTSDVFKEAVKTNNIKFSMDGKGRATDNAFIERLWRSVKYEKIYLNPTTDGSQLSSLISEYFEYYNNERRHSSIEDKKPKEVYFSFEPPLGLVQAA